MPLGLISSEGIDDYWSQNTRRKVFWSVPNGACPVTGLLSMTESEDTPIPEFGWNEERWLELHTTTKAGTTAAAPFYDAAGVVKSSPFTSAVGTTLRIYIDDGSWMQIDDVIKIFGVTTSGIKTEIVGRVLGGAVAFGADFYVDIELIQAATAVTNVAANVGLHIVYLGSAFAEGSRSRSGRYVFPSEIINYTQIHKTAFELTRNALKEPLRYDKTGDYKRVARHNGINHMAALERTFFEGVRRKTTAIDEDTGQTVRRGYSGGLKWFLQQWEKGSIAAGGAFDYGQIDVSAETDYITFTNKRIIKLDGNTITKATFNRLMSRLFEKTNNTSWDKLGLCGPEYLTAVAEMFEKQIQFTSLRDSGFDGFDFKLTRHASNAGEVFYKQHPLFTSPEMRTSCYYIDLGYLKWRPITDSDTDIQPMIQLPDADKRKDQWLTDAGAEIPYPEAHMLVENLGGITLS